MSRLNVLLPTILCAFLILLPGALLTGCGSTILMAVPPPQTPGPLTGNWLLVGPLPDAGPIFPPPPPQTFELAVSIEENGGVLTVSDSHFFECVNGGGGGAGQLGSFPVAADGSFTLQPPTLGGISPTIGYTVKGTAPKTAGGTWSGAYSATDSNTGCIPQSGTFTAVPIQPVTGTFAGSATLGTTARTPITITLVLQQGSQGYVNRDPYINTQNALSGTIKVQGTSCFANGTLALGQGAVYGGFVQGIFAMDDGSRLFVDAAIDDVAVSKIKLSSALVSGGQCDKLFTTAFTDLLRQ